MHSSRYFKYCLENCIPLPEPVSTHDFEMLDEELQLPGINKRRRSLSAPTGRSFDDSLKLVEAANSNHPNHVMPKSMSKLRVCVY